MRAPPEGPVRVLVVEDSGADARTITESLLAGDAEEFQVDRVGRLAEALDRLGEEDFDAMILDLGLPDAEAHDFEALTAIRKGHPEIPIVVLTVHEDRSGRRAVQQGAQDYLLKDRLDSDSLRRSVQFAIARQALASATAALERERLSRQHAVWINDTIVQGLVLAKYAIERGEQDRSHDQVVQTLRSAQEAIADLLAAADVEPGGLRRAEPSRPEPG